MWGQDKHFIEEMENIKHFIEEMEEMCVWHMTSTEASDLFTFKFVYLLSYYYLISKS